MNVGELIEKLQGLPPSTLVAVEGEMGLVADPSPLYLIKCTVDRFENWVSLVQEDDGKSNRENVLLISRFGQDDDAVHL